MPPKQRTQLPVLPPYGRLLIERPETLLQTLNLIVSAMSGRTYTDLDLAGSIALQDRGTLTIASDAITITSGTGQNVSASSVYKIDTESAAATDNLATINGGRDGMILLLHSVSAARVITLQDNVGNLRLNGNFVLDDPTDLIVLFYDAAAAAFVEFSRSSVVGSTTPGDPVVYPPPTIAHALLSASHSDTLPAAVTDGDIIIGNVTPAWSELAIAIPAASVRNVLGIDNAELRPSWKTALDATAPSTITEGAAASPGTSLVFAHRDHIHGAPATWTPAAHKATHVDTGSDQFAAGDLLNATARVTVRKNGGADVGTRRRLNLIEGTNITLTVADDAVGEEVDITIDATGGAVHDLLSATHSDTLAAAVVDGDVVIGNVTPKWSRLAISVPAANILNVLGVANAELRPSWKSIYDATNPTTIAEGAVASPGTSLIASHRDHTHGAPATWAATAHDVLSATHGDALAAAVVDGDVIIGNVTPKWSRLAISVPAVNVRNVLGIDNGELRPSWKVTLDATNPVTQAFSDAPDPGTSLIFAHRDHRHGMPASPGGAPTDARYFVLGLDATLTDEVSIREADVTTITAGVDVMFKWSEAAARDFQIENLLASGSARYRQASVAAGLVLLGFVGAEANPRVQLSHDRIEFGAGGASAVDVNLYRSAANILATDDGMVVNEGGADLDFRVEGVGEANLLFVDANTARVGIGLNAPEYLLDVGGRLQTDQLILDSDVNIAIAAGAITVTYSRQGVDTQGGAATDDLDTINGGVDGMLLVINPASGARTVVVKHNTGNILLSGAVDFSMTLVRQRLMLMFVGATWYEVSRSA